MLSPRLFSVVEGRYARLGEEMDEGGGVG